MPLICIGPVCIPISVVWGVLAILIKPIFIRLPKKMQISIEAWFDAFCRKVMFWKTFDRDDENIDSFIQSIATSCDAGKCTNLEYEGDWKIFERFCVEQNKRSIAFFTGSECEPCKRMYPTFDALAEANKTHAFVKVTIDDLTVTGANCGVTMVPTFQLYDENMMKVDEYFGDDESKLKELFSQLDSKKEK